MIPSLIEEIPNVSEGRDRARLDRLAAAIAGAGATLLDRTADPSHHRAVFTFAAEAGAIAAAAVALARAAVAEIDLGAHTGVHPRIGALDVLPFVPLGAATIADAVALAHAVGREIGETLGVPVFLYEAASRPPHRRSLEAIRRGGLAGLAARLHEPAWTPDYGPAALHPTAGAMAVGARGPLVAWNLVLDRPDLALARRIARTIRTSNGGLPCLKALGLPLEHTGQVQVSMNLTDYRTTSMADVFTAVDIEAARAGASIAGSEIIGLVPRAALADLARVAPRFAGSHRAAVLEDRLAALGLTGVAPDEEAL
jgi:glutamate formiminotransferase